KEKTPVEEIMEVLADPAIQYTTKVGGIQSFVGFMARVGTLKNPPADWRDMFFPEALAGTGGGDRPGRGPHRGWSGLVASANAWEASLRTSCLSAAALLVMSLGTGSSVAQTPDVRAVVRLDPALDDLVSPDARLERVIGGFGFTEGALWIQAGER